LLQGSRGAGVSIERGVRTTVTIEKSDKPQHEIKINGESLKSAMVSERVLQSFLSLSKKNYRILIEHEIRVPIGSGFGSSGASALSLALALNKGLELDFSRIKVAQIAHMAEIHCKTGLGTVIGETYGGVEIRVKPGAPGIGVLKHIPIKNHVVVCLHFGPIYTTNVLSDKRIRQRINELGGKLVDKLISQPNSCNFMKFSREFAEHVGLISGRMREVLRDTDKIGLTCSMMMLGESIFSIVKRSRIDELREIFNKYTSSKESIIVSEIDYKGARLL